MQLEKVLRSLLDYRTSGQHSRFCSLCRASAKVVQLDGIALYRSTPQRTCPSTRLCIYLIHPAIQPSNYTTIHFPAFFSSLDQPPRLCSFFRPSFYPVTPFFSFFSFSASASASASAQFFLHSLEVFLAGWQQQQSLQGILALEHTAERVQALNENSLLSKDSLLTNKLLVCRNFIDFLVHVIFFQLLN